MTCFVCLGFLLFTLSEAWGAAGQAAQKPPASQKRAQVPVQRRLTPAEEELQRRLDRVQEAKTAGNSPGVAHASEQLIALALRELGQLRLLEALAPQAIALYGRSLNFENVPDTRVDLAIAYLQGSQPDDVIREADRALLDDPNNARAFNALGRAWMMKKDFARAAQSLTRAAEIAPDTELLYNLGISLLATQTAADKARVPQVFEQMVKVAGDSGSIHVLFGRAYRDGQDMPAAARELRRAIEMDTRTPHAHYFLGMALMAQNEWVATPETKAELQKELQFYPHDYLANHMMGFIASSERRYEESERYLKAATTANPNAPDPWLYMGLNAYTLDDMKKAELCFRKAILLTGREEERANYQIRRAYIDLGRILTNSGRKEEAESYLAKGRDLQNRLLASGRQEMATHLGDSPGRADSPEIPSTKEAEESSAPIESASVDPFAHVDSAVLASSRLTEEQKQQAETQEKQLRAVLAQGYSDLATSEAMRKDYSSALGHYQEAEHWDPTLPGLMRSLGTAAFRTQNYPEAARGLAAALKVNANDPPVRAMLGLAYFGEEKYVEAAKAFAPLGNRGMQDTAAGYAWAASLAKTGDMLQASRVLAEFEKAERPIETQMLVGQLWIEIADYARAVAAFQRVWESASGTPKAHYFAGQAYLHWQHWNEAAREFQAELALFPDDANAKYNLGFVYVQQSKMVEAETLFREVIVSHPEHANAQYEFGKILLDRGEVKEAIVHLEMAARLSPQADFVHYQLQAAYRKDGRMSEADRELDIYKEIKAQKRKHASSAMGAETQ